MVELGCNYRLTDVMAALGTSELTRLDTFLASRRRLAARYQAALVGHWAVDIQAVNPAADPAWHLFVVLLRLDRLRVDRGAIYHALRAEGIGVNVHNIPVHRHPFYRQRYPELEGRLPAAEGAYERLLTLPLSSAMTDDDVDDVVAALEEVTKGCRAG
jgi:perosamine synthetase